MIFRKPHWAGWHTNHNFWERSSASLVTCNRQHGFLLQPGEGGGVNLDQGGSVQTEVGHGEEEERRVGDNGNAMLGAGHEPLHEAQAPRLDLLLLLPEVRSPQLVLFCLNLHTTAVLRNRAVDSCSTGDGSAAMTSSDCLLGSLCRFMIVNVSVLMYAVDSTIHAPGRQR